MVFGVRSEIQKINRKIKEQTLAREYAKFFTLNQNLEQKCRTCDHNKPLSEFLPTYMFRKLCKECHTKQTQKWRGDNKQASENIRKKHYVKSSTYIQFQKSGPCIYCHIAYPPYVMDFHHMNNKLWNISKLYGKKRQRVDEEMSKCILLCANCHRDETQKNKKLIPTSKNRKYANPINEVMISPNSQIKKCISCKTHKDVRNFTKLKIRRLHSYCKFCLRGKNAKYSLKRVKRKTPSEEFLEKYKDNKPCMDCGREFRYWMLDLDHIKDKTQNLNQMRCRSLLSTIEEVKKCELVCVNCHRKRTWNRKVSVNNTIKASTLQS